MIKIHEKAVRGRTKTGWLDSYHTFSFGGFSDPNRMGFGNLRVINEDTVIPGSGFAAHDHDNMDILTLVLDGALRHDDDQGNRSHIIAGDIQAMSAGSGVRHSEMNASQAASAHFLQIWLIPDRVGGSPSYAQAKVRAEGDVLLAGPEGSGALLPLRSATTLTLRRLDEDDVLGIAAASDRHRFVHVLDGLASAEGERVSAGDGLQIPAGETLELTSLTAGEALLFDMPLRRRAH
ncbi:MAG: pirin family protein [Pseudomonadota bacterium]